MAQSDGNGSAMGHPTDTWVVATGASTRIIDVSGSGATAWTLNTSGQARRSNDSGDTWPTTRALGASVRSISTPTAASGWAVGDTTIMRTVDGDTAATWSVPANSPATITMRGVSAFDPSTVWVVGDAGQIRSTTNGATTAWTTDASPTGLRLNGVQALNSNSAVAWGYSGLVVAKQSGGAWRQISIPTTLDILSVWPITNSALVAVGTNGGIYTTTDATVASPTWVPRGTLTTSDIQDVRFTSATNGMVVGQDGVMLTTTDAGVTWTRGNVDSNTGMWGMTYLGGTTFIAAGSGQTILRTVNGGGTWTQELAGYYQTYAGISMATDRIGWRVGSGGSLDKTTTGGTSWTAQTNPSTLDLFGVYAFDPLRAIAVGRDGVVINTTDGGVTWTQRTSNVAVDLLAIDGFDQGFAWAVGENGTIIGTADAGTTWATQSTSGAQSLTDVVALTRTTIIATGRAGAAWRTTNGAAWSSLALPTGTSNVRALAGVRDSTVVLYNSGSGDFQRSTDSGTTWTQIAPNGTLYLRGMDMPTSQIVITVMAGATSISRNGGVTFTPMGSASFHYYWSNAVDAVDRSTFVGVGDGGMTGVTGSASDVDDYVQNVSDWYVDGTEAFGVCLRSTSATPTWTANATCDQTADGPHWRGVPTSTGPSSEVARTAGASGLQTASFRFGLRIAANEPPGELAAGISFVLIAPAV